MRQDEKIKFVYEGGSIELSPDSVYFWKDQEGMGGQSADIYTTQKTSRPGSRITGDHLLSQSITLIGQINTDIEDDVAQARETLLRATKPLATGKLVYENSLYTRYIPCVVKEAPDPSGDIFPDFEIVFFCASPFWRNGDGESQVATGIAAWQDNIEFPLEIPEEGIEFTYQTASLLAHIVNTGDYELPIRIVITAISAVSNPKLINVLTQEYFYIDYDMLAGDVVTIDTDDDAITATLLRDGIETNIFNDVPEDATWLKIPVGDCYLRGDASNTDYVYFMLYYDDMRYQGV